MGENDVEGILIHLGKWGRYQILYYACICFVSLTCVRTLSYVFTSRDVKYRCLIPECDRNTTEYNPEWLKDFVPYKDNTPSRCLRYVSRNDACAPEDINKNETVICQSFVFERQETTIVHDFDIYCDENLWKLTIVGTVNLFGAMISQAYSGLLSDRFGRSRLMTTCVLMSCTIGIIKSFSTSYILFLFLEFLETFLCYALYGAGFILAMELVPHDERNKGNAIISCCFSIGEVVLGLVAWASPSWRVMLRTMYIPGLISVIFFWTVPESIRWLINHQKEEEAKTVIQRIARTNKKVLSDAMIQNFFEGFKKTRNQENIVTKKATFGKTIMNKVLFIRVAICAYIWICVVFVYYGLTIHSVGVSSDTYISFIFTVAIEIPGYFIYYYLNERIGRRKMLFSTLGFGGVLCVLDEYIPDDNFWCKLSAFLAGKCCLTIAYTVLYVYTTEMFPTCSRHSMLSICSMFGRIGSMIAPQIPLLARISKSLPLLIFGLLAASSGCLSLLLPETLNSKLPDTIEEAVNIGKRRSKEDQEINMSLKNIE